MVLFAVSSCSKKGNVSGETEGSLENKIQEKSNANIVASVDAGKKYAGIVCTENNKIGTECSVPGSSCKYYECNANSSAAIIAPLSYSQILAYADNHAKELVEKGLIDKEYAPAIIEMMKKALIERSKQTE